MSEPSMPATLPCPSDDGEVEHLEYPRTPGDPSSSDIDPFTTQDSSSESGGESSGDGHTEKDFDEGNEDASPIPSFGSAEYSDNEPAREYSSNSDKEVQQRDFSESEECSYDGEWEDVPIGLPDEPTAQQEVHKTTDDVAEDGASPQVPEPEPTCQVTAQLDLQYAEEPLGRQQVSGPTLDGGEKDIGNEYSFFCLEFNSVNNQVIDVDWKGLHRDPRIRSRIRAARMLIHPKSSELHVVPRSERGDHEAWIKVGVPPVATQVLVVESGPKQFGCTLLYRYTIGYFTFDPEVDKIFFQNPSRSRFDFTPLKGGEPRLPHSVEQFDNITIDRGIWTLAIDGMVVMEFEILGRRAFQIKGKEHSKRAASKDERPAKRPKLLPEQGELVLASSSHGSEIGNPIFSMKEGQKLVCEGFNLKRLESLFENANTLVWRGQYKVSNGSWENCVVKTIKSRNQRTDKIVEQWKNECDALRAVQSHENIVRLLKVDSRLNSLFFAPVIDAKPLSDLTNPNTTFTGTLEDARIIMRDIAAALAWVHAKGFAHADVRPANILYGPERIAVLIDFGHAYPFRLTQHNGGMPWYMPPEFVMDWTLRGPPGDVWALSIVAAWLTGYLQLPEKTWVYWKVSDLHQGLDTQKRVEASDEVKGWLKHIDIIRSNLRITDLFENIIFRGLDPVRRTRIKADLLSERLERLCLTEK